MVGFFLGVLRLSSTYLLSSSFLDFHGVGFTAAAAAALFAPPPKKRVGGCEFPLLESDDELDETAHQ